MAALRENVTRKFNDDIIIMRVIIQHDDIIMYKFILCTRSPEPVCFRSRPGRQRRVLHARPKFGFMTTAAYWL